MTVVQRSPNLGINIRLQPLTEASKPALAAKPKPPYWWGWKNAKREAETVLEAVFNEAAVPPGYGPGLWCAVVENAVSVVWSVTYTPKIWFNGSYSDFEEIVAWTGTPIHFALPPSTIPDSSTLFDTADVALPDPLEVNGNTIPMSSYWPEAVAGIPLVIATGNSLSVMPYTGSPPGVLTATASVNGKVVGLVQLTIKRVVTYTPT